VEAPARAWERDVLPARVDRYDASLLDSLCLTGLVSWARLSSSDTHVGGATPIALFLREHADAWLSLRDPGSGIRDPKNSDDAGSPIRDPRSRRVLELLQLRGALFANELAAACDLDDEQLRTTLADLVSAGAISSDGFAGLRAIAGTTAGRHASAAGRWFLVRDSGLGVRDSKNLELSESRIPNPES